MLLQPQCELAVSGLFTPNHSITVNITLTGGNFDLFDRQNRLHTYFAFQLMFVTVTVMESFGVNRPLGHLASFITSFLYYLSQ